MFLTVFTRACVGALAQTPTTPQRQEMGTLDPGTTYVFQIEVLVVGYCPGRQQHSHRPRSGHLGSAITYVFQNAPAVGGSVCPGHQQRHTCTYHCTKKMSEFTPKQFRFGNSSAQIAEYNSNNNSVRDSVILCSHCRDQVVLKIIRFGNHRARITENCSKIIKFGSVIILCVMV